MSGRNSTAPQANEIDLSYMRLEKFSYDGETARYTILVPGDEGNRSVSFSDKRKPHPDLVKAFQTLSNDLAELAEVSVTPETPVTVTELQVSRDKARMGFKIVGKRQYARSHGTMDLKPPMKWDEHSDDKQVLQKGTIEACHDLVHEVELYIKGKLAQGDLFEKGEEEKPEATAEEAPM